MEVAGWGQIWVYFGGDTRDLLMNHMVRGRGDARKTDLRPTAKFLAGLAGDTGVPFTKRRKVRRSRLGDGWGEGVTIN